MLRAGPYTDPSTRPDRQIGWDPYRVLPAADRRVSPSCRPWIPRSCELGWGNPTGCPNMGSRLSQHLLLAWGKLWSLLSCDVKSAFLKGDPFLARELYLTRTSSKISPSIPLPEGCLAKVLTGIFGLADAPREWWLRLARALETRGWQRSTLDQATWFLWNKD